MAILVLALESKLARPFLPIPVDASLVKLSELALLFSDESTSSMGQVIFEEAIEIKLLTVQFTVPFLLVVY